LKVTIIDYCNIYLKLRVNIHGEPQTSLVQCCVACHSTAQKEYPIFKLCRVFKGVSNNTNTHGHNTEAAILASFLHLVQERCHASSTYTERRLSVDNPVKDNSDPLGHDSNHNRFFLGDVLFSGIMM